MNNAWMEYWAETRQHGFGWFALRRGTALGLVMFGLLVMLPRLFLMVEATNYPIVPFIVFMLLGYGFSWLLWWANERSYQKLVADNANAKKPATEPQNSVSNDSPNQNKPHGQSDPDAAER